MNWLDIIILIVVVIAALLGLRIGIINAALSLAGLILGVVLAGRYYAPLAERLSSILQANVAQAVAFTVILIGTMVMAGILAKLLSRLTSAITLGWMNHLGGAVFGLIVGGFLCGALLASLSKFFDTAGVINQSSLAALLLDRFSAVLALLPDEFETIRSFFR